jgi:hypothetical protein
MPGVSNGVGFLTIYIYYNTDQKYYFVAGTERERK